MEEWIEAAMSQWRQEELEINPPASMGLIEKAESILSLRFPLDFKQLYLAVNGFVDFELRGFMLSLWSLERIIDDYNREKDLVKFGDHSISVCQYGFDKNKLGIYKSYTHHQVGPIEFITGSFKELISLFNHDDEILF